MLQKSGRLVLWEAMFILELHSAETQDVKENVVNFITGNKPLSEWDNYVKTLKDMGIEDVVAVKQAWYDRTAETTE